MVLIVLWIEVSTGSGRRWTRAIEGTIADDALLGLKSWFVRGNLGASILSIQVHLPMLRLLVPHPHVVFEGNLSFDQVELSDKFDEIITTKPLSILLEQFILIHLVYLDLVASHSRSAILNKDVKLDKLKTIIGVLSREY